ncbi:MAG: HAD family hydrolase [Candidatus Chromulinivorax sp.]
MKIKALIFDLDGVLCTTDQYKAFKIIGFSTIIHYLFNQWKLPKEELIYKALAHVPAKSTTTAFITDTLRMPPIMVDWQSNLQPLATIQKAMLDHIKKSQHCKAEKKLLEKIIELKTTPEQLIASRKIIPESISLLHQLKEKGYQLYIISNWDASSFPLLERQFPAIFSYQNTAMFDGIITSGQVQIVKPNVAIFELALKKFNLKPQEAIFIDDVIENIQAARNIGIQSIHCIDKNIKNVKKHLFKFIQ